jgi:hypothetical protein
MVRFIWESSREWDRPGPGGPGTHAKSGSGRRTPHGREVRPGSIGRPGACRGPPRQGPTRGRSEGGRCRADGRGRGRGEHIGLRPEARAPCRIAQAIGAAVPRMRPLCRGASGRDGRGEETAAPRARGEWSSAGGRGAGDGDRPRPGRHAIARLGHVVERDRATDVRREREALPVDGTGPHRRHECADRIDQQRGRDARTQGRRHAPDCARIRGRRVSRVQTHPVLRFGRFPLAEGTASAIRAARVVDRRLEPPAIALAAALASVRPVPGTTATGIGVTRWAWHRVSAACRPRKRRSAPGEYLKAKSVYDLLYHLNTCDLCLSHDNAGIK